MYLGHFNIKLPCQPLQDSMRLHLRVVGCDQALDSLNYIGVRNLQTAASKSWKQQASMSCSSHSKAKHATWGKSWRTATFGTFSRSAGGLKCCMTIGARSKGPSCRRSYDSTRSSWQRYCCRSYNVTTSLQRQPLKDQNRHNASINRPTTPNHIYSYLVPRKDEE